MKAWMIKVMIPSLNDWEDTFLVYGNSVVEAEDIVRRCLLDAGIPKDKEMYFSNKTILSPTQGINIGRIPG